MGPFLIERRVKAATWIVAVLVVAFGPWTVGTGCFGEETLAAASPAPSQVPPRTVSDLLERVQPWLVSLEVDRKSDLPLPREAEIAARGPREARAYFQRPVGPVTGLLVDARGFVLTSFYNIAGEVTALRVRLDDGRVFEGEVRSRAPADDLALVQIVADEALFAPDQWVEPPWATTAPSAGHFVFALGRSPDPERPTLTEGIVSSLGRNGDRTLQTDAKLNYGNIGGPLLDLDGRIVGMTGFVGHVYTQWGFNSGIGFATTVDTVRELLPSLLEGKDVGPPERPFLGIQSEELDPMVIGARVVDVVPDSSASSAGVEKDDVIVEFDGTPVTNFNQLRLLIYTRSVGEKVTFKVKRGEEMLMLEGVLGRFPRR